MPFDPGKLRQMGAFTMRFNNLFVLAVALVACACGLGADG